MRKQWKTMPPETRRTVYKLAAKGMTLRQIAAQIDYTDTAVWYRLKPLGGVTRPEMWNPTSARLSLEERIEIYSGLQQRLSLRTIARSIGRSPSTVSREVALNGGSARYQPMKAHRAAERRARRPKPTKLSYNGLLCRRVAGDLRRFYSPEQISARLKEEFGEDASMSISHETIYKTLFVQGRGELRKELTRCLRSGRARRIPNSRLERRGRLKNMVLISERPAEVEDRAVPGHWEGDLLMGKDGKTAIGTLVERSTRYVMLFPLPNGFKAEEVRKGMTRTIKKLPESLRRTLTVDRGREMAEHARFRIDTGVDVYFCDPHSPWQRGSNENTNGLLRQYFPKGTDFTNVTAAQLRWAQETMNDRPRETLGWKKPKEKLAEFVALTG